MTHKRVRITQRGWDDFTGQYGPVMFDKGVSVHPLPPTLIARIGGLISIVEIDEEGNERQAGPSADLVRGGSVSVEPHQAMTEATESDALKERLEDLKKTGVPPTGRFHTVEELEAVVEENGIKGLREIADKWGVKDRSIPGLLREILKAQAEFQRDFEKRVDDVKAKAEETRKTEEDAANAAETDRENAINENARDLSAPDENDEGDETKDETPNAIDENGHSVFADADAAPSEIE